jgi:hypothetical protein
MKRPTGVTILAVLSFLSAAFLVYALLLLSAGSFGLGTSATSAGGIMAWLGRAAETIGLVFTMIYIAIGIGLLKLMNWARLLLMILLVLGAIAAVIAVFSSFSSLRIAALVTQAVGLAFNVLIFIYLLDPHVKQAFTAGPAA